MIVTLCADGSWRVELLLAVFISWRGAVRTRSPWTNSPRGLRLPAVSAMLAPRSAKPGGAGGKVDVQTHGR